SSCQVGDTSSKASMERAGIGNDGQEVVAGVAAITSSVGERLPAPRGTRVPTHIVDGRLSEAARLFYDRVWASARAGCLNLLGQLGCSETEAEELFAEAFSEVMGTVDPIERRFGEPQMVNLLKVVCRRRLADARRRRGVIREVDLSKAEQLPDEGLPGP